MEEVIQKLSEIETTAQRIMEDANSQKEALSSSMRQKYKDFDQEIDTATAQEISKIRESLEADKEKQLSDLNTQTEESFKAIDHYYEKNHDKLAQAIFQKIINQ